MKIDFVYRKFPCQVSYPDGVTQIRAMLHATRNIDYWIKLGHLPISATGYDLKNNIRWEWQKPD